MTRRYSRRGGPTIGTAFDPRANSLNAVRLLLALLVLVAHSGELGGYGRDLQPLGTWAVAGFFGISGYLITGSREHSASLVDYLWRRLLRIYPAFVVVLVVVAFVIAPASGVIFGTGRWVPGDALAYVLQNAGLWMARLSIGDMLATAPFPGVWNGSLWTLAYEFACYLVIGCLFLAPRAWLRPAVAALFVGSTLATLGAALDLLPVPRTVSIFATLMGYFSAGAVVYLWRDRIPLRASLVLSAAVVTVALAAWNVFPGLAGLPMAYLLMALGIRLPLHRIGARTDISYGVYIYAFPLQQVIASATTSIQPPLWFFIALSVAGTLPFAWASALLIEQPALRANGLFSRRRRGTPGQGGHEAGLP